MGRASAKEGTSEPTSRLLERALRAQAIRVTLRPDADLAATARQAGQNGLRVEAVGPATLDLSAAEPGVLLAEVARLSSAGLLASYETRRRSLEDGFLELTGKELRD